MNMSAWFKYKPSLSDTVCAGVLGLFAVGLFTREGSAALGQLILLGGPPVLLLVATVGREKHKPWVCGDWADIAFVMILGVALIQLILPNSLRSGYPYGTEKTFWWLLSGLGLFWTVRYFSGSARFIRNVCLGIGIAAAIGAAAGLMGVSFPQDLNHPTRGFGLFLNHNRFAGFSLMGIGCLTGLCLTGVKRSGTKGILFLYLSLIGLLTVSVFASMSRSGTIALVAGVVYLCFGLRKKRLFPLMVLGVLILSALPWLGSGEVHLRWRETWRAKGENLRLAIPRLDQWPDLIRSLPDHPLTGVGLGAHVAMYPQYKTSPVQRTFIHAENEYLEWLFETGLLGLPMLGLLLVGTAGVLGRILIMRHTHRTRPRGFPFSGNTRPDDADRPERRTALCLGLGVSVVAMGVLSFADFGLHWPVTGYCFVVVAAMLLGPTPGKFRLYPKFLTSRGGELRSISAVPAVVLSICGLAYAGLDYSGVASRDIRRLYQESYSYWRQGRWCRIQSRGDWTPAVESAWRASYYRAQIARRAAPADPFAHLMLARLVRMRPDADAATIRRHLRRALKLGPTLAETHLLTMQFALGEGRRADAARYARKTLQLNRNHWQKVCEQWLLVPDGHLLLPGICPNDGEVLFWSADFLRRRGAPAEWTRPLYARAVRCFDVELNKPRSQLTRVQIRRRGRLCYEYARSLRWLGRDAKAVRWFQKAVERDPAQTDWRLDYARSLNTAGRTRPAIRQTKRCLRWRPGWKPAQYFLQRLVAEEVEKDVPHG